MKRKFQHISNDTDDNIIDDEHSVSVAIADNDNNNPTKTSRTHWVQNWDIVDIRISKNPEITRCIHRDIWNIITSYLSLQEHAQRASMVCNVLRQTYYDRLRIIAVPILERLDCACVSLTHFSSSTKNIKSLENIKCSNNDCDCPRFQHTATNELDFADRARAVDHRSCYLIQYIPVINVQSINPVIKQFSGQHYCACHQHQRKVLSGITEFERRQMVLLPHASATQDKLLFLLAQIAKMIQSNRYSRIQSAHQRYLNNVRRYIEKLGIADLFQEVK